MDIYLPGVKVSVPSINTIITLTYGIDRKPISGLWQWKLQKRFISRYPHEFDWRKTTTTLSLFKSESQRSHPTQVSTSVETCRHINLGYCTKEDRKEYTYIFGSFKRNRSYLFGRLLAIYDWSKSRNIIMLMGNKIPIKPMLLRLWTAYTVRPQVMGQRKWVKHLRTSLRKRNCPFICKIGKKQKKFSTFCQNKPTTKLY